MGKEQLLNEAGFTLQELPEFPGTFTLVEGVQPVRLLSGGRDRVLNEAFTFVFQDVLDGRR